MLNEREGRPTKENAAKGVGNEMLNEREGKARAKEIASKGGGNRNAE